MNFNTFMWKCGSHGHAQRMGFFLCDALSGLHCNCPLLFVYVVVVGLLVVKPLYLWFCGLWCLFFIVDLANDIYLLENGVHFSTDLA